MNAMLRFLDHKGISLEPFPIHKVIYATTVQPRALPDPQQMLMQLEQETSHSLLAVPAVLAHPSQNTVSPELLCLSGGLKIVR